MVRTAVVFNYCGKIILIIGVAMLTVVLCSFYYKESISYQLLGASLIPLLAGTLISYGFRHNYEMNYRESFAIVTFSWITASLFGTLPYIASGYMPSFANALFETVSGFSTTGATVLYDVEALPHSLLYWRSLTQWLGGMGIMALFIAVIVGIGSKANQIFRVEVPGPVSAKVSPRIRETAKILWTAYVSLSVILLVLLYVFGMDFFDALCHTFSTMATGGFSTKNQSVAYYQTPVLQWIIILFMFISGASFSLHYLLVKNRSIRHYLQNREFIAYFLLIAAAVILILINMGETFPGLEEKIRAAVFQTVSILTTTGFSTDNYDVWTPSAQTVLFVLMFIGGCAGSTSGNAKIGRYMIMLRRAVIEFRQMIHPQAIIPLRFGDKVLSNNLIMNVMQFFFIYILIILTGTLVLSFCGLDIFSSFSASLSSLANIGPGWRMVGPAESYAFLPDTAKYMLALFMLIGRLEILPVIVIFFPQFWQEQ